MRLVGDTQRVDELVHERADLPVDRLAAVNDDPTRLGVAPAAGRAGDRLETDGVAKLRAELAQRLQ